MNRNATQARAGASGAVMALSPGTSVSSGSVPGPPPLPGAGHLLYGIAATASGVWVVGASGQKPLAARWDGASWTIFPDRSGSSLASAALLGARLRGIASGVGPEPAPIAVGGAYDRLEQVDVALIRHWTGSEWTSWDKPGLLHGIVLNDVAFDSSGCAWAVGHASPHGPRVLRWDGTSWESSGDIPDIPRGRLVAVAALAPDDVWAVGSADRDALILHFDGRAWTRVPGRAKGPLAAVSATAPDDVWAVGHQTVMHWNGNRWSRVKTPLTSANTVTAQSRDDIWAAGGNGELAHYDGHRWTVTPSPESTTWLASSSCDRTVWLAGTHTHEPAAVDTGPKPVTAHPNDA
ncbi:hypothetical protein [Actinomadura rupiterrae]|uniref:hypothetical protein n=1 Tax=Actinomadura rupiterrae TaxID=559627 RepID=UPI0020A5BA8E|nr:hypothetical protein [Actinomadura rupiterrae]MCP2340500.1 hypothetical protein [Actinomadura rupiterrae]